LFLSFIDVRDESEEKIFNTEIETVN